jgi:hypothetical protein
MIDIDRPDAPRWLRVLVKSTSAYGFFDGFDRDQLAYMRTEQGFLDWLEVEACGLARMMLEQGLIRLDTPAAREVRLRGPEQLAEILRRRREAGSP